MKLVLTHSSVDEEQLLLLSFKADCLVRKISDYSNATSLLGSLDEIDNISHLAFVYKSDGSISLPFFTESAPSEYAYFNQEIISLIRELKIQNAGLVVDILTCNLNKPEFAESVAKLEADLSVDVRYSLDQTGNAPEYNWTLESDSVDIKDTYFTDAIAAWSGVLDSVSQQMTVNGVINAVEYDSTHIYIGGTFTTINGVTRNRLARFFKDGALDTSWNPNVGDGIVHAIAINSTDIYIGGTFTLVGGQTRLRLARFTKSTGALDNGFTYSVGAASSVFTVNVLALDGNFLYVGGDFTSPRTNFFRLSLSTSVTLDSWPSTGANTSVRSITINNDHIYVGGTFTSITGVARTRIARFIKGATPSLDPDWTPTVDGTATNNFRFVSSIVLDESFVYIGGGFSTISGSTRNNIGRVSISAGAAVDSWAPTNCNNHHVWSIAVNSTHIYAGGQFTLSSVHLVRFDKSTGSADSTWNPNVVTSSGSINSLKIDSDMMYLGGNFTSIQSQTVSMFSLYNLTTSQVANLQLRGIKSPNNTVSDIVKAIAADATHIYIGGSFTNIAGNTRTRIARYNRTTGELDSWNPPGPNGTVNAIVLNSTYIYIGGAFTLIDGVSYQYVARYDKSTGEIDTNWKPSISFPNILTLALDGSSLYYGGQGSSSSALGRIDLTTNLRDWSPTADGQVNSIVVTSSTIYVAGAFATVNGVTRNRLVSFTKSPTITLDAAFPNINTINSIAVDSTYLYAVGSFTSPTPSNGIARLNLSSRTFDWTPTDTLTGALCIAVDSTHIYIGGTFTAIGATTRNRIARYTKGTTPSLDTNWNPNANAQVNTILADSGSVFIGGMFSSMTTTASLDLMSNSSYITWTNTELVASKSALTSRSLTVPTRTITQRETVTDNFVNFSSITGTNVSVVRHALLNVLESINPTVTTYFMPRANLGLSGSGNVQVYLPYQRIDVTTVTSTNPVYVNLYQLNDYVTFTNGTTTKTITKTSTGYSLDGVTYADNDIITLLSDYSITFGGVYVTAGAVYTKPSAPSITSVSYTLGDSTASISFTAPTSDGGAAINLYTVTGTSSNGGTTVTATGTTVSPITVSGFTLGATYIFTITARNAQNLTSDASSASSSITVYTKPTAPSITSVNYTPGQTTASVVFSAPSSNGGAAINLYTVTGTSSNGGTTVTATGSSSPISLSGFTATKTYTFTMTARNAQNLTSDASATSSSISISTPPGAPQSVSATSGNGFVDISFSPAAENGSAITQYTVSTSGKTDVTGTSSPIRFSGLTNGQQYTFSIKATNIAGDGESVTVLAIPIESSSTSVDTSSINVSNSSEAAQIIESVSVASSAIIQQVATEAISQVKVGSSISNILTAAKNINTSLSNNSLKQSVAQAAGKASVSTAVSTASSVADKINEYVQRINDVKTATLEDSTLESFVDKTVQGATEAILNVNESIFLTILAIIIAGNVASGPTRPNVKSSTVATVEERISASSFSVSGDELTQLVASLPADRKTSDISSITDLTIIAANKVTKTVVLPVNGNAWYVPMIPDVEYTFTNSMGSDTVKFVFNATTNTMTKDGVSFTPGTPFTLNSIQYPTYALGSLAGGSGTIQPKSIEVNLNVEINANGTLNVLGYQPTTPSNLVIAANTLPVDALYDSASDIGLIEFWEPDNLDDIEAQLASTQTLGGVEGYKITAKKLALGLQNVLIGELDAKSAEPFSTAPKYGAANTQNGNRVMTGFGRLALMAYAHYIMGHVQATAAITNDTDFMKGMLSLNSDTLTDYKYANVGNYDAGAAPWSTAGTASDANLAVRLVKALLDANTSSSLVSNGAANSVANIVQQVIGQDASRATDEDNNKYSPENHGLLRFYPDDVIYVSINLTTPDVTVGTGQLVDDNTLEGLYTNATGDKKYTLKITLGPASV